MNRFFYIFFLCFILASCDNSEMGIKDPELEPKLVDVSFEANIDKNTKMWYGPDATNSKFYPKWNIGDQVTIVVDLDVDIIDTLTVTSITEKTIMEGSIPELTTPANLHAIYPYKKDAYSHNGGKFAINASSQVINTKTANDNSHLPTDNAMSNSILIATASDVINTVDDGISVKNLYFRQAMSFLRFTLKATEEMHTIKRIALKDTESNFITEAEIWLDADTVKYNYPKYSTEVSATIEGQDLNDATIINFALLPTTLRTPVLEIQTTDKNNNNYIFTKQLAKDLNFKRNTFNYFGKELDLLDTDFEKEISKPINLESISPNTTPPAGNY